MSTTTQPVMARVTQLETLDPAWKDLYRIGGWAALITAILFPIQIAVFIVWPPPGFAPSMDNALSWLTFFNANKLLGLLDLDLLIIIDLVLGVPVILAVYAALRRVNQSVVTLGLALGLLGTAANFAANPTLSMLALSDQYAAATGEAGRSMVVSAAQVLLANYQGTSFHISYILGSLAPLLLCVVMLRSNHFPRAIAYIGIIANVVSLGLYIPVVGLYISIFSVVLLEVWNILMARRLLTA